MKEPDDQNPNWKPYRNFSRNADLIDRFFQVLRSSFGLSLHTLIHSDRASLDQFILPQASPHAQSHTAADHYIDTKDIVMNWGWITVEEFAERANCPVSEISNRYSVDEDGVTKCHPDTKVRFVIWPEDKQRSDEAVKLRVGMKNYTVTASIAADVHLELDLEDPNQKEHVRNVLLKVALNLGEPTEIFAEAEDMSFRSCFLLYWVAFEVFIRNTVFELVRMHRSKFLTKSRKNRNLSLEQIADWSEGFKSMDAFFERLMSQEVESREAAGEGINGLINFLKSEFTFESDPYTVSFVMEGLRVNAGYNDLVEVKEVRNALLHDGGVPVSSFFDRYPKVPRHENEVCINGDYYQKSRLLVEAIAFKIADMIDNKKYQAC